MRAFFTFSLLLTIVVLMLACNQRDITLLEAEDSGIIDIKETGYTEYEIIKDIRITASDTKTWGGFGWVREAEDSIFAVRDDVPESCYKGPNNKEVIITLDIYTVYKKALSLKTLSIEHNQKDRIYFNVNLLDNCQRDITFNTQTTFETPLNLDNRTAGCVTIRFKSINGFEICSISLISTTDAKPVNHNFKQKETDKKFGIIEGFYGVRWSDTERERLFVTLSKYGLGMYVYAPKDEPKHREKWREEYLHTDMKRFSKLSDKAKGYGVDFYYAISPFIDFDYTDEDDYKILLSKLKIFSKYGIKNFAIFADDIEMEKEIRVNAELGKIHTDITNRIYNELKSESLDIKMLFVGTVYSDERITSFEDGYGYMKEIANLNSDIEIFWTGLKTSGATLTEEDIRQFTNITGKKPLIWDNFWANDGGDGFLANLYLSDYTGRDKTLIEKVSGIAINPLIQGSLTRFNLMRFGRWKGGDISDNWIEDELNLFGYANKIVDLEHIKKYLLLLIDIYNGNSNKTIQYLELDMAIEDLLNALKKENREETIFSMQLLYKIFAKMYVIQNVLYNSIINSELFDEMFFPTEKVKYDAIAGIYALQFLTSKLNNEIDYSLEKKMKLYLEKSANQRFIYSAGKIKQLTDYISNTNFEKQFNINSPIPKDKVPKECSVGKRLSFKPFSVVDTIELYGLSNLHYSIENQAVILNIPYAGNYSIAIIGYTNEGAGIVFGNLICK